MIELKLLVRYKKINISSFGKILPKTSEVVLSNLSKFGGTNLHLLHVMLLQCIKETLKEMGLILLIANKGENLTNS
jgi:hypothetical protein